MKILMSAFLLTAVLGPGLAARAVGSKPYISSENLTVKKIMALIRKNGAHKVTRELYHDDKEWVYVNNKIMTGRQDWLNVARSLLSGSDGGVTSTLTASLGQALDVEPAKVLRTFGSTQFLDLICAGPDVDSPKYSTRDAALSEIDRRIRSLKKVTERSLRASRNRCVKSMESSRASITKFFDN